MRFIQVGVGGFGANWVRTLKESPSADVVGLVDLNEQALDKACEVGGYGRAICFKSIKEALAAVKADAVVTCTPPAFHRHDAVAAMRAGLHVISEKPMSDTLADCKAILRTAIKTKRTYCISQNYRYTPAMSAMARLVRSGRLGAVGQVKLDFYKGVDFGGGFRHDMPFPVIIDMSIHHFDLIRFITGLDAVSVRGAAWNPSWSNYKGDCSSTALFEMNSGARVLYNASWCAKGSFCDWNGNWQIECERGTITYREGEIRLLRVPRLYACEKIEVVPHLALKRTDQHAVLADFIRAVRGGRRPSTDVFDNMRSVAMVFATVQAMQTGRATAVLDGSVRRLLRGK